MTELIDQILEFLYNPLYYIMGVIDLLVRLMDGIIVWAFNLLYKIIGLFYNDAGAVLKMYFDNVPIIFIPLVGAFFGLYTLWFMERFLGIRVFSQLFDFSSPFRRSREQLTQVEKEDKQIEELLLSEEVEKDFFINIINKSPSRVLCKECFSPISNGDFFCAECGVRL